MGLRLMRAMLCGFGIMVPAACPVAMAQSPDAMFKASTDGFIEMMQSMSLNEGLADACMPLISTAADFLKQPQGERDVSALVESLVGQARDQGLYDCGVFTTAMATGLASEDAETFQKGLDLAFLVSGASVVAANKDGESAAEARANYALGYTLMGQGNLDDAAKYFCDAARGGQVQAFDVIDAWPTPVECSAERPASPGSQPVTPPAEPKPPEQHVAPSPSPEPVVPEPTAVEPEDTDPDCRTSSFEYYDGAGKLVTETSTTCDD